MVFGGAQLRGFAAFISGLTLSLAVSLSGCQRLTSGDLSGDLFVTMQSGDVKRGADVEIALVRVTPQFEGKWKGLVDDFGREYSQAASESRQAASLYDQAFESSMKDIGNGAKDRAFQAAFKQRLAAMGRVKAIVEQYQSRAVTLIRESTANSTRTDVNGHYQFSGIATGTYYLFAHHTVFENSLYWMPSVDVKRGQNRVALSNSNAGWPFGE